MSDSFNGSLYVVYIHRAVTAIIITIIVIAVEEIRSFKQSVVYRRVIINLVRRNKNLTLSGRRDVTPIEDT